MLRPRSFQVRALADPIQRPPPCAAEPAIVFKLKLSACKLHPPLPIAGSSADRFRIDSLLDGRAARRKLRPRSPVEPLRAGVEGERTAPPGTGCPPSRAPLRGIFIRTDRGRPWNQTAFADTRSLVFGRGRGQLIRWRQEDVPLGCPARCSFRLVRPARAAVQPGPRAPGEPWAPSLGRRAARSHQGWEERESSTAHGSMSRRRNGAGRRADGGASAPRRVFAQDPSTACTLTRLHDGQASPRARTTNPDRQFEKWRPTRRRCRWWGWSARG